MIIASDYDGVLLSHPNIPSGENDDKWWENKPIKGSVSAIRHLINTGHEVYVCTAREEEDWPAIENWLEQNGFPKLEVTNKKKIGTSVYIDDRAVRFTNWKDIYKLFI